MPLKREVGHFVQRLPVPVARDGRPLSIAHWSGAIGSITTFPPAGMLSTIHARAKARVSGRASSRSLWIEKTSPCAHKSAPATATGHSDRRLTSDAASTAAHAASRHSSG